jgi:hypothetical protein
MTANEINRFIDSNKWAFAKTMPDNPHWYVVRAKCNDEDAFEAFVMHIREHGYPVLFRSWEYTCFDVGGFRYWTMGDSLETTTIINRATNEIPCTTTTMPSRT